MRTTAAFARADARLVRRDALMILLVLAPPSVVAFVRVGLPQVAARVERIAGVDVGAATPTIVGLLLVVVMPLLAGVLASLLVLDERDDATVLALRVSPLRLDGWLRYRVAQATAVGGVVTGGALAAGIPAMGPAAAAGVGLLGGLSAGVLVLVVACIAGSKVEALAVLKAAGLPLMLPLAVTSPGRSWGWLLAAVPSFWPVQGWWAATSGRAVWPWVAGGILVHAALLAVLWRPGLRRLSR